jgi:hypothetical protein
MTEHFAPQVIVDGITVTPEGWMWILGLALGGSDWAIKLASDPAFDLRGKMADYNKRRNIYYTEEAIVALEKQLEECRSHLREYNKQ